MISSKRLIILVSISLPLLIFAVAVHASPIVISELMWSGSDLSSADEWIELTNTSSGTVSLSGWTLTKLSKGEEVEMIKLGSGKILSNETFLISNYSEEKSRLGIGPDYVSSSVSLANTKLLIKLYNSSGTLIDTVDDGIGKPFAGSNTDPKASMERINLSGSGQIKDNWQTATTFINFDDGVNMFGTPGAENGTGAYVDTFAPAEVNNFAAEIIQVQNIASGSLLRSKLERLLKLSWTPSDSLDISSFYLSFNGTGITLSGSSTGITIPEIGTGTLFTIKSTDTSGNSSSGITVLSTMFPNIRITEVLANPKGKDDEEWIEIGNLGSQITDVSGWILDDGNSADHFEMPTGTILEPGEHKIFPKSVTRLPLGNKGEEISLKRGLTVMDTLEYKETAEEVSFGISESGSNLQAFCVSTPNMKNVVVQSNPMITIQSGDLENNNKVTLNLIAEVQTGSTVHASCKWNYAENYKSDSCNPPSHTFSTPGTYPINLTYTDFCGNSIDRKIIAVVNDPNANFQITATNTPPPSSSGGGSRSSSGGGSGGGGQYTTCKKTLYEGLRISEFVPNPKGKDEENEWIELENTLDQNIDLCGWFIDDISDGSKPYSLDTYRMSAKQFLILPRSETNITLNNTNDSVRLFAAHNDLIEEITYKKSYDGKCYARNKDGEFEWTGVCTEGMTNRFAEKEGKDEKERKDGKDAEIDINNTEEELSFESFSSFESFPSFSKSPIFSEIYPNPSKGSDEYFELYNPHKDPIDLTGWILDDNPEGSSKPITLSGMVIMSNEYKALYTKISINNEGEELSITSPDKSESISVTYPKLKKGNSYVFDRRNNKWKTSFVSTPGKRNIIRNGQLMISAKNKTKKVSKNSKQNKPISKKNIAKRNPMDFISTKYRIEIEEDEKVTYEIPKLLSRILPQAHAKESAKENGIKPLPDSKSSIFLYIFIPSLLVVSTCRNKRNMI
jgi:hypothetical protein